MENADYHLIKPVESLPTIRPTVVVDRESRQGQRNKDKKQRREESEPSTTEPQGPLEMTEPDMIESDLQGDDPHAIDYRA